MHNKNLKNVSKASPIEKVHSLQLMIIITCLLAIVYGQCPESCLTCSTSGTCTSCVSQNNLLMLNGTLGCLPCPSRCEKCISQNSLTQCSTCSQGYYLDPYLQSCYRCKSSNCLQCNEYFPSECQLCQSTYFLEESTISCKYCSSEYNGAKTCRQNFILTCQEGYFTINGQVCSKCDTNGGCKTCVSGTVCSQCFEGFYLLSGKCLACDISCKTCNTNTSCTSCPKGFRINTSSKCQACSASNCAACTIQDICQQCTSFYYLEISNKTCILLDSSRSVQNCSRYASNFNQTITTLFTANSILCRTCANGTYLNSQTNTCQMCSLLCENCGGMYRSSKCSSCNPTFGRLIDATNGICTAKLYTANGQKVVFVNNRNDFALYNRTGKTINFTQGILKCPGGQLASQVSLNLNNIVGYQYTVYVKLLIQSLTLPPPYNINVLLNSQQIALQSITTFQQCNDLKIAQLSFSFSVSQFTANTSTNQSILINYGQPNIVSFRSTLPQDVIIDVRQFIILVKECHQTCALCDSYDNCLQCKNDTQFLQQEKCQDNCDSGYFLYSTGKQCLLQCPKGTYPSIKSITWTCQPCPLSCSSCTFSPVCTACTSNFYLYSKQCLSSCPLTYFKNSLFGKCQKCTLPCDQCLSIKQCLSCQVGFYYSGNNTCLMQCPDGFYGDLDTMVCKKCKEPCFTCKSETECLSCTTLSGLTYMNFQCTSTCPSQYFRQVNLYNQSECQTCQFPCLQCTIMPTKCTQCIAGFLLSSNNTCVSSCPQQYFSSVTYLMCMPCEQYCRMCMSSQKICTTCMPGYLLMNSKCVISCGEGFYQANSTQCKACKDECSSCLFKDQCTKCKQTYYLQGKQCLTQCYDGYYKALTINGQRTCSSCSPNCKKCFGQNDYCLQCYTNFFLQTNNTCSSTCLVTQLYPGCSSCEYPCYSCSYSITNCTSCVNTYYFSQQTNQCVTQCYYGYYKAIDKGFGYCKACQLPCTNCQSPLICYSCTQVNETSYYLQTQSSTKKLCVKECGVNEYRNDSKLICLTCVEPCLTCKNATYCLSCVNGVLIDGNCGSKVDGCSIGSYRIQTIQTLTNGQNTTVTTCHSCPNHCSSCKSQMVCTGCVHDFYLLGQTCVDYCPSGSSPIKDLRKCIFCEYPCAQCQGNPSYCTKCNQTLLNSTGIVCPEERKLGAYCIKYYVLNGECVSDCPSMTFPKGYKCVSCISPCETCASETVCTSCVQGYFMLQNSCFSTCPDQYYAESLTQQCQKCIYPCKTCKNKQQCLQCQEGYLFQNKCLIKESCPVGYYQTASNNLSKFCEKCNQSCLACMDSKEYCLECTTLSVHEGKCLEKCPNGYYSQIKISSYFTNTSVMYCEKCSTQCLTCSSTQICETCAFSYSLLERKCVKRCPPNYMQKFSVFQFSDNINYTVSSCAACTSPCNSCFLQETLCQSCLSGFYMYEQKCLVTCPEGTYLNQLTKSCKECPFPCKICKQKQKDVLCMECSKGYYAENSICVDKCNEKFVDFDGKKCVQNCDGGYEVEHIVTKTAFCTKQCQFPYLINQKDKQCVINCSQNEYISADFACQPYNSGIESIIPKLRSHLFIDSKGILNLYIQVTRPVDYTDSVSLQSTIQITLKTYKQENTYYKRLLTETATEQITTQSIPFVLTSQSSSMLIFSLYPTTSVYYPSSISLSFKSNSHLYIIDKISKLPLQSSSQQIEIKESQFYEIYDYVLVSKNRFGHVGEIFMDFVLILGLAMVIFNRFAKIYHLLIFAQSVFMIVCLDTSMPPNLFRFLQGFKFAHFYQLGNWFDMLEHDQRYSNFQGKNFNRIESIFGDITFIRVVGHLIGFYCIMFGLALILYGVRYLPDIRNEYVNQILHLMGQKFKHIKWSHLTDVFMSTFMLILAGFFFQTIDYSASKTQQSVSIALSYIFLLILLSYAVYFCYKTYKMSVQSQKQPQKFVQKGYMFKEDYVSFYEGISSPQNSYNNYMIVGKILVYGGLGGLLWKYPNFCLSVWIVVQLSYAVIYLQFRPFADDIQNYMYSACGFVYAFTMILMIVVNQCQKPSSTFFIPQSQQSRKILVGYFIIVLVLICIFILIIEMIISIMRGNLKPRKLEGEQEEYNEVKENSPNSLAVTKLLQSGPKKIWFEQKRQFIGYEMESFVKKRDKNRTSIKEE